LMKNEGKLEELVDGSDRIAILVPNFSQYSGDARVAEVQARDLARMGKQVTIFALDGDISTQAGIDVIRSGMPQNPMVQRVYRLLFPVNMIGTYRLLKKLREYDLLISHLYPMNWVASMAKGLLGKKYVYWYHGIPPPDLYPFLYERLYIRFFIYLTKMTIANADKVISVSQFAKGELRRYTGHDSDVVYNRPDISKFDTVFDEGETREKYSLGDEPIILSVGRICPQKGFHLLIKVHRLVRESVSDAKLIIVGKPVHDYYMQSLRAEADENVLFVGYVDDEELSKFFRICDIYATCSLWETYNLPLVEALEMGKPAIAFDIGPHPEVANDRCVLVNERDLQGFANACIDRLKERSSSERGRMS
jgi:glycosyltransferase involved in cell wall biosynthesis